ncbi:MAG: glutamate--tRNA ligase [Actinobacteria bacterium]|uniref:glutamate--tRNA ligase n=1 Tax=freshwater metagenome TaxID=449393 RepID=A0A6J6NRI6_9ZZZZ|nr:glutamate--tRNA ligase [Actinomycetota bacterium]
MSRPVRVRFAPSPTGDLHVGNIRTALYDWAYARHTGGKFVFRIEDTDRERVTDEYINAAIDTLKWLGLQWDEGPEVGGPSAPYLQSQRLDIYADWAAKFLAAGDAYHCYCNPEELEASREAQKKANVAPGYDGKCRTISSEDLARYQGEGRKPVVRMRMPDGSTTFYDAIRGDVTFDHNFVPDFVLVRADGSPLYTLAVAVDDVMMQITHVLRGEDLLSSTPRQIRVYQAMGVNPEEYPIFAHLPFVMGQDNAKLSKRNGEVSIAWYRERGFLPEAICNYLALLGWSPGDDKENISMQEMTELFTIERVGKNPARFDMKKLEAINGDKIRALPVAEVIERALPFMESNGIALTGDGAHALFARAIPLIHERIVTLAEIPDYVRFLFAEKFTIDPEAKEKALTAEALPILAAAEQAIAAISQWQLEAIESALRAALIEGLALKPKNAFTPVRVAVTGARVSPPLFESIELLGKERTLERLKAAQAG